MKLDILTIAAHPDDAEFSCAGTLISHAEQGYQTGILDLTRGELGSRGTPETRAEEAKEAARIMGVQVRENMEFRDGFFENDELHQRALIHKIRQYQPEVVLTNPPQEIHPDHVRAAQLVVEACFLSGLSRIETTGHDGESQEPWRPKSVYHFIQYQNIEPDFVVDITPFTEKKMEAIYAYQSLYPRNEGGSSYLFEAVKSRWVQAGMAPGVEAAEGFLTTRTPGVKNILEML